MRLSSPARGRSFSPVAPLWGIRSEFALPLGLLRRTSMVRRTPNTKAARSLWLACLLAVGLVPATAGCSDEACFSWTKQEGSCPAQTEAIQFFSVPGCNSDVESVDSEGEYVVDDEDPIAGDLCCYTVT